MYMLPLTDQEGFDGCDIAIGCRLYPFAKLFGIEPRRRNSFAPKQGCIAVFYEPALVNHYDHSSASESVVVFLME
jgi:hypothetical protein